MDTLTTIRMRHTQLLSTRVSDEALKETRKQIEQPLRMLLEEAVYPRDGVTEVEEIGFQFVSVPHSSQPFAFELELPDTERVRQRFQGAKLTLFHQRFRSILSGVLTNPENIPITIVWK